MNPIIENLKRLNRKERFHLLQSVLHGGSPGSDSFTLSAEFRESLGRRLGLTVPSDAFAAMDYQLDWIYVALYLALHSPESQPTGPFPKPGDWFNHDQEDTDLLVAFECPDKPGVCHLVLVEAKCDTNWTNSQVESKLARLESIHDALQLPKTDPVAFHWVLTSPRRPEGLRPYRSSWLDWGSEEEGWHWIEMPVGPHCRAVRCNPEGTPRVEGGFWQLVCK
jgi:hypothetical protein